MPLDLPGRQNTVTAIRPDVETAAARGARVLKSETAPRTGVRTNVYWVFPYVAVALFAATMLALVWMLQRQEIDAQRDALVRDMQWVEQSVRMQMQATDSPRWRMISQTTGSTKRPFRPGPINISATTPTSSMC